MFIASSHQHDLLQLTTVLLNKAFAFFKVCIEPSEKLLDLKKVLISRIQGRIRICSNSPASQVKAIDPSLMLIMFDKFYSLCTFSLFDKLILLRVVTTTLSQWRRSWAPNYVSYLKLHRNYGKIWANRIHLYLIDDKWAEFGNASLSPNPCFI